MGEFKLDYTINKSECSGQPHCESGQGPNLTSSQTIYFKGMACLQEAPAGCGDCNGDPHLPRGSGRCTQEHEVRQSSGIRQPPPRIPKNSSDANYLGKEPPQELENYKKIVAIQKPGKDPKKCSSYRPISRFSMYYKLQLGNSVRSETNGSKFQNHPIST